MNILSDRIDEITSLIVEVANGNFDYQIEASHTGDELDAVIAGINMLGQELKKSTVSRDFMQSIYQGVVDMLIILNNDFTIRSVNEAFIQLTGFKEFELKGFALNTIIPELDHSFYKKLNQRLTLEGKWLNEELLFISKQNYKIPASCSFSYIMNNAQEVDGILVVAKDITKLKQTEKELLEAKQKAETANEAKSDFLSTMSHEIRTPLNAVTGFTHLLLNNSPRTDQFEYLEVLKYSADNLLTLINNILDFSKIEAGKIEFESVAFNPVKLITDISNAFRQNAKDKGLVLNLSFAEDLPTLIIGDSVRLNQILTNLISNAIKFTKKGCITISVNVTNQKLNQIELEFKVADTGIGIAENKIKSIFEVFTQAESAITREFGGSGLGLTIVKHLLQLQQSDIVVESEVGKGSVFSFNLLFEISNHGNTFQKIVAGKKSEDNFRGIRLLIAEDNEINTFLLEQFLTKWDISFDVAEDGRKALELVKKKDYHLILMDLQMPEMDGYAATKAIRQLKGEKYQTVPIIALTASALIDIQDKVFEVGMNDYLSKPFNPDELYRRIKKYCFTE